ncbi:CS1 type fimbrial major subunit [Yersinia ruckeri]|nr:CS1 type fimbrial major subunit [Yersinia ruckeri]
MKKLAISTLAIATLASFPLHAVLQQDVDITAEITENISISEVNGSRLGAITLVHDLRSFDQNDYAGEREVRLNSSNSSHDEFMIYISGQPTLMTEDSQKAFENINLSISGRDIGIGNENAQTFSVEGNGRANVDFRVTARAPANAVAGEVYVGVIPLMLESSTSAVIPLPDFNLVDDREEEV